jgi:maltooligosyltrehalose trehalohydrolase
VWLTGEAQGYYRDYQRSPLRDIARSLASGFVYQGETSAHRDGRPRGEASGGLAPTAFVNFLQNHDQIGNRPLGDRLENLVSKDAIEAALAITLLAPPIPMLFMGEEWGSKTAFPFFCDFTGDLAKAVREGRRREYGWAYAKYGGEVPDPLDLSTFRSAKLDWDSLNEEAGRQRLALVRDLLTVRRREIMPRLANAAFGEAHAADNGLLTASWQLGDGARLLLRANLSTAEVTDNSRKEGVIAICGGPPGDVLPPWSVFWCLEPR